MDATCIGAGGNGGGARTLQEWYDSAVRFDLIKEIARDTEICIVIRKTGYLRLSLLYP
jgi:hypothetical protein